LSAEHALSRRALLAGGAVLAAGLACGRHALARGRLPLGGRVTFHVPWPLGSVDPHAIDDVTAAIVGGALFDTLYAAEDSGAFAPSLAEAEPEVDGQSLRVTLRGGLRAASGRAIEARDVAFSIARARANGARAWLAEVPPPKLEGTRTLVFEGVLSASPAGHVHGPEGAEGGLDARRLVRALGSPLVAIVPVGFSPEKPDGTGPFRAQRDADGLVLRRNAYAASGPSFVDEVLVHAAPNLAASLQSFESGVDDIGWLGSGLHEPRPGARTFDAGMIAWALLRTGHDAGNWDAPGVAQQVADGIPPGRVSYLALGAPWKQSADDGWGGAPCELLVRDDAVWLVELARAIASSLTRPAHEVVAKPIAQADFAARRASRAYALALDVARPLAQSALGIMASLATADNPAAAVDVVRFPPRGADVAPRTTTRTMRVGVVGEVRVQGGRAPGLNLAILSGSGIDLGSTYRTTKSP